MQYLTQEQASDAWTYFICKILQIVKIDKIAEMQISKLAPCISPFRLSPLIFKIVSEYQQAKVGNI